MKKELDCLESVIANIGEGLVLMDSDNTVRHFNRAAETILELRAADFLGMHGRLLQTALEGLSGKTNHGLPWADVPEPERMPGLEYELGCGSTRRKVAASLFAVGDGTSRLMTGIRFRDITGDGELHYLKTKLMPMAAHEIRGALAGIRGFSELLLRSRQGADEQEKSVQYIHRESMRLSSIVDNTLSASCFEAGAISVTLEPVKLADTVKEVLTYFRTIYPEGRFSYEEKKSEVALRVLADKNKLGQVLRNLIENAVKYSAAGSPVGVFASRDQAGRRAVVAVKDKGIGIPHEEMTRLFNRFHRVNSPQTAGIPGTGLGLYIVRSLIEAMGGNVWAESETGVGSTFSFNLRLPAPNGHYQ